MKVSVIFLIIPTLTSCATNYQPHTWSGGYKDSKLGEGHYFVEYYGNGTTSMNTVEQFWERRALELCPNGFDIVEENKGANNGGAFTGGSASVAHPWKKSEIKCK